jgi:succinoglycan biosynthesis protein ExoO
VNLAPPLVSVVMANFNGARHLAAAVRSVLDQSLSQLELIVVDDASTDDSLAVIGEAANGDPRVIVLVQPHNGGPGAARNRALEQARGRWVAIADSDDELDPHRLACLVRRAERDGAQVVVDNMEVFSDAGAFAPHPFLPPAAFAAPRWIGLADFIAAGVMYGSGPDLGFLKPVISAKALAGLRYDESLRIGEDYDLIVRLLAAGGRMRFEPQALYRYRKHAASISHRLDPERVRAMLAAQARFEAAAGALDHHVARALTRRRRSLETALVYERIVNGVKAGAMWESLTSGLGHPTVWPLLTLPIRARLRRFAGALARPAELPQVLP